MSSRFSQLTILILATTTLAACQPPPAPNDAQNKVANPFVPPTAPAPRVASKVLTEFDAADGLPLDLKHQCAVDICGTAEKDFSERALSEVERNRAEALKLSLKNQIEKSIRAHAYFKNEIIKAAHKRESELSKVKFDKKSRALVNLMWASNYVADALPAYDSRSKKIDGAKLSTLLSTALSADDIEFLKPILENMFQIPLMPAAYQIRTYGLSAYLIANGSKKDPASLRTAARSLAIEVKKRSEHLRVEFPGMTDDLTPATDALIEGRDVSPSDALSFASDVSSAWVEKTLYSDLELNAKRDPHFANVLSEFFAVTEPKIKADLAFESLRPVYQESLKVCGITADGLARLQTHQADWTMRSQTAVEQVRAQSLATAASFTKDEAVLRNIGVTLASSQFVTPDSYNERIKKLNRYFDQKLKGKLDALKVLTSENPQELATLIVGTNLNPTIGRHDIANECEKQDPEVLSDKTLSSDGFTLLSWASAANAQATHGVIAHEFGHIVSRALLVSDTASNADASSDYSRTKACLDARVAKKPSVPTTEDDFADLFAAKVLAGLEVKNIKAGNMGCLLAGNDGSRYAPITGLAMNYPARIRNDHSTDLFRMIEQEIDRGRTLSSACGAVVDQSSPAMRMACTPY